MGLSAMASSWVKGENSMKKRVLLVGVIISLCMSFTSYAGWEDAEYGKKYRQEDGTYASERWLWIDGNADGIAECYCFFSGEYLFDFPAWVGGFFVNANGQWEINGVVQTKPASEIVELNKQISKAPVVQEPEPTSGWMKVGIDKIYKDPNTGINLTGWHELSWDDGGKAWFYFGSDGLLYRNRITPDGYIVDSNGVMFDENVTHNYNWSTTISGEYGGFSISDSRFVKDYFNNFPTDEMSFEDFKAYLTSLGVEIINAKQSSWKDEFNFENSFYSETSYDTRIDINYKGLHFAISSPQSTSKLSSTSQMWVVK